MKKVFRHQYWHFMFLITAYFMIKQIHRIDDQLFAGSLLGVSTRTWFLVSITIPIVHQIYVLICWRFEFYFKSLTKLFGKRAFVNYKIGFFVLFMGRFVFLVIVALSNKESIDINSTLKFSLIGFFTILAVYAFYSVKRYFGFDRAAGLDHFDEEVSKLPFIKEGIFKYTNNGMYKYAFLIFYIPGLVFESKAAILVAIFSHIYIWVHYYCTELPDMKIIYEKNKN